MKYLQVDEFGKYLILKKDSTTRDDFYKALDCKETMGDSLQNSLCNLFCSTGENVESIYKAYLHDYPSSKMKLLEFVAWYYSIDIMSVDLFLKDKREDDILCYIDNALINGYGESFILNDERLDEETIRDFQVSFKEAIKLL